MGLSPIALYALVAGIVPGASPPDRQTKADDMGQFRLAAITGVLLSVLTLIIVAFLLSGVADPFFNATENITDAVETASTGNDTIDQLMGPFGILVAAVLTVAFIAKILEAT